MNKIEQLEQQLLAMHDKLGMAVGIERIKRAYAKQMAQQRERATYVAERDMETCPFCFVWKKYLKKFYAYVGILGVGIDGSGKYQGEIQMVSKKIL